MSSIQTLIPVVRPSRKTVLGGFNTGGFIEFLGTETTYDLPNGPVVPISKWYPDNVRDGKREWFMVYIVDERNFREEEYSNFTDFVPVSELNPVTTFLSPATMPNIARETPGTLLDLMNTPSVDLPPVGATPNPVTGLALKVGTPFDAVITTVNTNVNSGGVSTGSIPAGMQLGFSGAGNRGFRLYGTPSAAGSINFTYGFNTTRGALSVVIGGTVAP